jgi:protein ImuB
MFAVVYLPDFALQAVLRADPDLRLQPVALIDSEPARPEIIQFTAAAKKYGVVKGMTPSQAAARCGHLKIKLRSTAQEQSATEILLQTAQAFSPNIESTSPGVCTLELKGLGLDASASAQTWAETIPPALAKFYFTAKIGMAPTPELALLAAHQPNPVSIVHCAREFVVDLPVSALDPPPEIGEILLRWGIHRVGQLLALGKNQVGERLGAAGLELFRRVSPDAVRPLKLVVPPVAFSERMEFENEIETMEPLLFVLRRFVEQLSQRLELVYLVVAEFHFQLGLVSGDKLDRIFKIPSPTGNIDVLFRTLQTYLETVRTDSPIVSLCLTATPAKPPVHQFGLFESTLRDPNQFAETIARLNALVGPENAGTPQLISTHKPDSFRMQSPDFDSVPPRDLEVNLPYSGLCLRRFRPPRPAHFEFRAGKPALIRGEFFVGPITRSRGPFLGSGNWWDKTQWTREEWDIETAGGLLLRIFRSPEGGFVEGFYD